MVLPPTSVTIADIPGIIKGAAEDNRGLGHDFLRHIERSKMLVYVIDLAKSSPWLDLKTLVDELEAHQKNLALGKKAVVIANKADISALDDQGDHITRKNLASLNAYVVDELKMDWEVIPVSAKYRRNVAKALWAMRTLVDEARIAESETIDDWRDPKYISGVYRIE